MKPIFATQIIYYIERFRRTWHPEVWWVVSLCSLLFPSISLLPFSIYSRAHNIYFTYVYLCLWRFEFWRKISNLRIQKQKKFLLLFKKICTFFVLTREKRENGFWFMDSNCPFFTKIPITAGLVLINKLPFLLIFKLFHQKLCWIWKKKVQFGVCLFIYFLWCNEKCLETLVVRLSWNVVWWSFLFWKWSKLILKFQAFCVFLGHFCVLCIYL